MMITQAIKRWLHKMFAWWPWKTEPEVEVVPVTTPIRNRMTQNFRDTHRANNAMPWSTHEGFAPQSGVTPLIFGQGEPTHSTFESWPERFVPSSSSPLTNEKNEPPSPVFPTNAPLEPAIEGIANTTPVEVKAVFSDVPLTPTPQQQLEFLAYLVQRGLVNEGFPEDQIPDQYRKK